MSRLQIVCPAICLFLVIVASTPLNGQGITLRGVGSVNEGMAGAATAAPIDAAGAVNWNPASIAAFQHNEATMGMTLILPDVEVSSSILGMSGTSRGESGVSPIPSMALVYKTSNPRVTLGFGAYGIAGFKVNYDASLTNPILMPQGTLGPIPSFGRVNTEAEFFQLAPTVSVALSDQLAIGVAPTLTLGRIAINPFLGSPPINGQFPDSSGTRYHFGGGAQVGLFYIPNCNWRFGATLKSPQWFEEFRYKSQDSNGLPVNARLKFDYPMIASVGTAYYGMPGVVWAFDVRYFDYENTDGFGDSGMKPDGTIAGVGWSSLFAVATGVQKQVSNRLTVRGGYVFNSNPINQDDVLINTAAPVISQHVGTVGFTYAFSQQFSFSMAYLHAFENNKSGPYVGLVPGSTINLTTTAYAVSSGFTVKW